MEMVMNDGNDFTKVTRVEVIDPEGRKLVYHGDAEAQLQDDGKTLKVFLATRLGSYPPEKNAHDLTEVGWARLLVRMREAVPDVTAEQLRLAWNVVNDRTRTAYVALFGLADDSTIDPRELAKQWGVRRWVVNDMIDRLPQVLRTLFPAKK